VQEAQSRGKNKFIILALGDSLTAGYGLAPQDSFASRLEQALRQEDREVRVVNGGVSGDTAQDGLRRLKNLLRHEPDLVIVQFGANDMYMGLSAEEVRAGMEKIIDLCRERKALVLLAGIISLQTADDDYNQKFHRVFEEVAGNKDVPLLKDFMPGIPGNPEFTLADGIHPNEAGVDEMVKNILPLLRTMLP